MSWRWEAILWVLGVFVVYGGLGAIMHWLFPLKYNQEFWYR